MSDIAQLAAAAREEIESAASVSQLEDARVRHLGRSAPLVLLLRDISGLPPEDRARVGKEGNIARQSLEKLANERGDALERDELQRRLESDSIDVTLPPLQMPQGTLHILTQTRRLLEDTFVSMGYTVADGPEVDSDFYNFTALNTPEGHPARSAHDTFYIDGTETLLRTQTSPVQVRVMQSQPPPVYIVSPGRVYRRDRIDATHSDMFHQIELLAVDEGLTLADLKGTIETFCRKIFGADREIRLRTHFFPFTEPSVETDISCYLCGGSGEPQAGDDFDKCRLCRGIGWIELGGAGMVDPNVFEYVDGYDPEVISGFAFGFGIDRVAMLRHSFPDLRHLFENDLRFLSQFRGFAL